ncbi:MAG: hypothetical protein M3Z85_22165 [Acidobacteriota bacterium]|nr:hypothetical protein [Acidobacteriota bacterium]
MPFLAVLTGITLLYLFFGAVIWFRTRNFAFPFGLALLYYWTLYGGWFIVIDRLRGYSELRYEYLYAKLFPVYLDDSYLWTLIAYGTFLLSIEAALLAFAWRVPPPRESVPVPYVSHTVLLTCGVVIGFLSFWVVRGTLGIAAQMNVSSYEFVRLDEQAAGLYKVHQILMRAALFSVTVGLAIIASGKDAKLVRGSRSIPVLIGYAATLSGLVAVNIMLGQRRAIAAEMISGGLFYLVNVRRPSRILILGGAAVMIVGMGFVSMTRGGGVAAGVSTIDTLKDSIIENVVSNEPFAAHLSLYGSIAYKLPASYGSSLVYLTSSLIPGIERPADIYEYYAEHVMAIEGQGYTVHHATGWYLNFGMAGVFAGGVLLGTIWAVLFGLFQRHTRIRQHVIRIAAIFTVWTFTAFLPSICRAGPEAYKGMLLEVLVIPIAVMAAATTRIVNVAGQPSLAAFYAPAAGQLRDDPYPAALAGEIA